MTEPVTPTTNDIVYQCIVDLHGAGKIPTREVIVSETRLKFSVVDDHVKRLRDDGRITKVVNGVFHPVVMHTEYPSTATAHASCSASRIFHPAARERQDLMRWFYF